MSEVQIEQTGLRSRMVGGLRAEHEGEMLTLAGWVHRRRDLGGLLFVDLRDRSGLLQVSFGPDWTEASSMERAHDIGHEDVIRVEGVVAARPEGARKDDMVTGAVELRVTRLEILSDARTPEIPVYRAPEDELPAEELRLQHRVLDLRRPELQKKLVLRHRLVLAARNYLDHNGFVEVETPILTKATPEGARDYLVPSRVHKGEFYALPQSPQIYKQILMVAGFDRYFQIARCFRDEDLRADRQPEFTQIDVEASFVEVDDILRWMEGLMAALAEVSGLDAPLPFPRLSWSEAIERYGSDRPDLRYDLEIEDWTEATADLDFGVIRSQVEAGGRVRGFRLEGGGRLSRREIDAIEKTAKAAGAPGLLWGKRSDEGASGPLGKFMTDEQADRIGLGVGDLVLVSAGKDAITSRTMSAVRDAVITALDLPRVREHAWLWVTDFPVFDEEDGVLAASHHPFVMPHPDDINDLEADPASVRGTAYDLVYNGTEFGSGSIRIHDPELQRRILRVLGLSEDEIEEKFGFLLNALSAGAPPHGGIALGMDRIVQRFTDSPSLRDTVAFPKTTAARALFEGAPMPSGRSALDELGLQLKAQDPSDRGEKEA
ncbi:MAG: aspartate--tRNA ligase [Gemmatimonadota bacterium]|nr:aspartate--tRNA ligase [Gemmatimonadota bacterium]MDE3007007.1 aspartate--tRNA ligase [Gemmatimonadota bacterium]MDE3013064.1 aspartate--tRNA ligase [Gemmatimonadota bacterium]